MKNTSGLNVFQKGREKTGGRKKGTKNLATVIRELGQEYGKEGKTKSRLLAEKTYASAYKTDGQSRKLVYQYDSGMPAQSVNLESSLNISFDGSFIKPKAREMIAEEAPKELKKGHLSDLQHKDIAEDSSANKEPVREDKEDKTPHP